VKLSQLAALAAATVVATYGPLSLGAAQAPAVCVDCIKANMQALAGDELRGRGCGTADENAAATYVANTLKAARIAPGLPHGEYLQPVRLETPTYAVAPTVTISAGSASVKLTLGAEMVARDLPVALSAPVVVLDPANAVAAAVGGKAVIYDAPFDPQAIGKLIDHGAALVVSSAPDVYLQHWTDLIRNAPGHAIVVGAPAPPAPTGGIVLVRPEVMASLRGLSDGQAQVEAPFGPPRVRTTYNVVGLLHGKARDADRHAILLTAHYDHLGVRDGVTFHGANDDASGTSAVLEFARIFGARPRHARTIYFGLMGCEEEGLLGAQYFFSHPPMALSDLVVNLEFEMIGVDDPARPGALMLTGWERTDLGPALAAHGAKVQPDGYPKEHFFQRSDNYQLALRGVVAQTVSAWPTPPTYHQPTDDLAHVDFDFMGRVIGSMIEPLDWLLDSDFQPQWLPGQKP
jgi:hypothetical protein